MKIAGLTWWRNNYGSILQAYALQSELTKNKDVKYEILCQYGKSIQSFDNLIDKIKTKGVFNTVNRIFWKFILPGVNKRNQNIQKFVDENLNISSKQYSKDDIKEANKRYDIFVCGSDQIWNLTLESTDSIYWLGFVDENKIKFSYAPSIGVDSVNNEDAKQIKKNLESFNGISCREETGTNLINKILGVEKCVTVIDPTLLVEKDVWENICSCRKYNFDYIFVYMLRGTKKQRKFIEGYAKKHKLKIITIPFLDTEKIVLYDSIFGDIKYWDANPADFISVIKYAKYVFTDSFHCMIFSCLYHKEFYVFPKIGKSQLNRMIDLQKVLGTGNRMIEMMTVEEINNFDKIDWKHVDRNIEQNRNKSKIYLYNCLGRGDLVNE